MKNLFFHTADFYIDSLTQEVLSEGVQLFYFLVDERREIQIPLLAGHYGPASKTPFKWSLAGVQIMAQK